MDRCIVKQIDDINTNRLIASIYVYKVVISVWVFVCTIITQEHVDRFVPNFDLGTRETHGNILSLVLRF